MFTTDFTKNNKDSHNNTEGTNIFDNWFFSTKNFPIINIDYLGPKMLTIFLTK